MLIDSSVQVGWVAGACEGLAAARHVVPDNTCAHGQLHDLLSRCPRGPFIDNQLRLPCSAPPWLLGGHAATWGHLLPSHHALSAALAALVKGQFAVSA